MIYRIIIFIISFLIPADYLFAGQKIKIENIETEIKESVNYDNEIFVNLPAGVKIKSGNGNVFSVLHKSEDYLKNLHAELIKSPDKINPNTPFEKFLTTGYAYDLVISGETGAIKEFISAEESAINGNRIPPGVYVRIKHNNVAWIVDREIKVWSFSLEKLTGDRKIAFSGKTKTRGHVFTGAVAVDNFTISGFAADAPVKQFNCVWENVPAGQNYGMVFDADFNVVSARLSSGIIYGFSDRLNYIFSSYTEHDGPGVLKKIQDDKGRIYYGETGNLNRQIIQRSIKWNDIVLNENDVLTIKKDKDALPQDSGHAGYSLYLKDSRKIRFKSAGIEYSVRGFPYGVTFYGNFNPESFVTSDDAYFETGPGRIKAPKDSLVNFYMSGALSLIQFSGIIALPVLSKNIKFRENIAFYDNGRFREGVLAESINLQLWGRDVTVGEDSVLRFSMDGEVETVTARDDRDRINIIYAPEIE